MSRDEFIKALRKGKWWHRRQALIPREATMHDHASRKD
jgi:hypothetical protein